MMYQSLAFVAVLRRCSDAYAGCRRWQRQHCGRNSPARQSYGLAGLPTTAGRHRRAAVGERRPSGGIDDQVADAGVAADFGELAIDTSKWTIAFCSLRQSGKNRRIRDHEVVCIR